MRRGRGTGVAWDSVRGKPSEPHREGGDWDDWALSAAVEERAVLTLVSLHNVQVFRLLLKTSVERNTHELNLFLAGFAVWQSLVCL